MSVNYIVAVVSGRFKPVHAHDRAEDAFDQVKVLNDILPAGTQACVIEVPEEEGVLNHEGVTVKDVAGEVLKQALTPPAPVPMDETYTQQQAPVSPERAALDKMQADAENDIAREI